MTEEATCPLNDSAENRMNRLSPKNADVALCYQLHDDVRVAFALAHIGDESFAKALRVITSRIEAHEP